VRVSHAHPERAGYVWAEDGQISAGWVPMDVLDLNSGRTCARSAYCSAELTVAPGDTVRLMWEDAAHGTWWCEDNAGERGWVRRDLLELDE
jgi:plastocyanin